MAISSRTSAWVAQLTVLGCLLASTNAFSQPNYQSIPMGERAVGMGGAATALSDDESGAYYNPAGPAFTEKNSLSVTTNLYGLVFGSVDSPIGTGVNVSYSTLNLVPATSSSLFHLGTGEDGKPSRWVFCFNVFAPGNFSQQQRTIFENRIALRTLLNKRHILAGPTLAVRLAERWAVGLSLFGSINTIDSETSLVGSSFDTAGNPAQVVDLNYAESGMNFGLAASAGVRFKASDAWSFGISVRSPVFHLVDSSTTYVHVVAASAGDANPVFGLKESPTRTRFEVPTKLSLGVAWTTAKKLTLSLDFNAHLPQSYVVNQSSSAMQQLQFTPNAAIGIEGFLGESVAVRGGLFTDIANVTPPAPEVDFAPDKIDTFGATLTFSFFTATTSSSVGIIATYSTVQTLGYDFIQQKAFPTQGTQGRVFLVLGSSFDY